MLAFVLKRTDSREFDQTVTLFTDERGKIDISARGIKKSTAKNSMALEPFALIDVAVTSGKEFPVLTTAQIAESYLSLRETSAGLLAGATILRLVDELTPVGEPEPDFFLAIRDIFLRLAVEPTHTTLATDRAALSIVSALGFAPEFRSCVVCGVQISQKNFGDFGVADGGVRCSDCAAKAATRGVSLTPGVLIFLANQSEKTAFTLSEQEEKLAHKIVYDFLVYHTGKKVPDWATGS